MNKIEKWVEKRETKQYPAKTLHDIDPATTALVVIDMVNGFAKQGTLYHQNIENLIEPIRQTMKGAKAMGIPIIGFGDAHEKNSVEFHIFPEHCLEKTEESAFVPELQEIGTDVWIPKKSTNSFLEEQFQEWLKENKQIGTFIVAGDCTDICILQFVLSMTAFFTKEGQEKRVIVPVNLVDTFSHEDHPSEAVNLFSFYLMEQAGAELVEMKNI
ncbi:cysteine hydrolase family protein [Alteribacillus bidgolensis]|uniref:Nicotinamidase-related amidase n=1 Tax=Alteribacillus bidgolensis TaxID=930129 RepID=A0A1G8KV98_9BACI|nr:isochorismatase family cysteine hydrolase [Alteribacillus bidgolensis]SDI47293.1 Nicotinamidase-related amidase [Alteribacillus bidgolensis]